MSPSTAAGLLLGWSRVSESGKFKAVFREISYARFRHDRLLHYRLPSSAQPTHLSSTVSVTQTYSERHRSMQ